MHPLERVLHRRSELGCDGGPPLRWWEFQVYGAVRRHRVCSSSVARMQKRGEEEERAGGSHFPRAVFLLSSCIRFLSEGGNLKKKTKIDPTEAIQILKSHATIVHPKEKINVIQTHEADNRILECAVEARVHTLVTGNMRDIRPLKFFRAIEILSPREFLAKYF